MALMQISVVPLGTGTPGVGKYVADIALFLKKSGVNHQMHDMGTVIHGSADQLFRLAQQMHRLPFAQGAKRVVTTLTIDERVDTDPGIGEKKNSVDTLLQGKK